MVTIKTHFFVLKVLYNLQKDVK